MLRAVATGAGSFVGILTPSHGGTGVANADTSLITLGGALTLAGAFATTLTVTAGTALILPTIGTLATLAGSEALTNKTLTTFGGAFTFNPANLSATLSPTGSGTVTINPATAGAMDNVVIGANTRAALSATTGNFNNQVKVVAPSTGLVLELQGRASDSAANIRFTTNAGSSTGTGSIGVAGDGSAFTFATSSALTNQFSIDHTASAVNIIHVTGGATGSPGVVTLSAQGSDSAINIAITPKGTGLIALSGSSLAANASTACALTAIGPTGAHTTVQEWFVLAGTGGAARYVPGF